jgi:transposase
VTRALAGAVAVMARSQSWQETARVYRLNWKSVASVVRRTVEYGLAARNHRPLHHLGIDKVSRKKGHQYLTVVYDLERRVLVWVGPDRTEQTLQKSFTGLGRRRCASVRIVCMDMWEAYAKAVRQQLPEAQCRCRNKTPAILPIMPTATTAIGGDAVGTLYQFLYFMLSQDRPFGVSFQFRCHC